MQLLVRVQRWSGCGCTATRSQPPLSISSHVPSPSILPYRTSGLLLPLRFVLLFALVLLLSSSCACSAFFASLWSCHGIVASNFIRTAVTFGLSSSITAFQQIAVLRQIAAALPPVGSLTKPGYRGAPVVDSDRADTEGLPILELQGHEDLRPEDPPAEHAPTPSVDTAALDEEYAARQAPHWPPIVPLQLDLDFADVVDE
eukprot:m.353226 g.353226  ORF g.353226 m.353226 type:complete len:201 (-) comp55920_c0_seq9:6-608(-)